MDYKLEWFDCIRGNKVVWDALTKVPVDRGKLQAWFQERATTIRDRRNGIIDAAIDS